MPCCNEKRPTSKVGRSFGHNISFWCTTQHELEVVLQLELHRALAVGANEGLLEVLGPEETWGFVLAML